MAKEFEIKGQFGFAQVAILTMIALYLPIILIIVYSFNAEESLSDWGGFSLRWYYVAWENEAIKKAAGLSLFIATIAMVISTTVSLMAALVLTRGGNFRGKGIVSAIVQQPLMVPEIVTAVALMIVFAMIKVATGYTGLGYLIFAHSAFCVPFAFMPIRARLLAMDTSLETAAADLYARPWQGFYYVTLPLLLPSVLAGAMLAFIISLDDVVITEFVKSAGQDTLPTFMLGQLRRIVTPDINVIATVLVAVTLLVVPVLYFQNKQTKEKYK